MAAWLEGGDHKGWRCEDAPSVKTGGDPAIHVHGSNRVCVNDAIANGAPPFAAGAASVKEVYSGGSISKLYAMVKVQADSDRGEGWYWFEQTPGGSPSASLGRAGCVGCHAAAGTDAEHPGPGDYVYSVVE